MKTDSEIKLDGLKALAENLGQVEAERFISLLLRESFDYTKWQRNLFPDKSIQDVSSAAMELRGV